MVQLVSEQDVIATGRVLVQLGRVHPQVLHPIGHCNGISHGTTADQLKVLGLVGGTWLDHGQRWLLLLRLLLLLWMDSIDCGRRRRG